MIIKFLRKSLMYPRLASFYVVEDDLKLPVPSLPPEFWNYTRVPLCQVYRVLGLHPRALCALGKYSVSLGTPLTLRVLLCFRGGHLLSGRVLPECV